MAPPWPASGLKILLVDDSAMMRKMIARALRQSGLPIEAVEEAGDGAEALELLKSRPVDVVFSDWNMPVMDGLQFLKKARETHRTPIVMLTTELVSERAADAAAAGANGYLTKPFTPESLRDAVHRALGD